MPLQKTQKTEEPTTALAKAIKAKADEGKSSAAKKSSPRDGKKPKRLPFRRFFSAVREDVAVPDDEREGGKPSVWDEALAYYEEAIKSAEPHMTLRGNLETLAVETPGLAYFYRGIRTDAQQIRRWLEKQLEMAKAEKFKWFHSDPDAIKKHGQLKVTEISKYVDADEDIENLVDLVRVMAEVEHRLEDLMEGFEERRLTLARIIDIRKEGLKEVWIDAGAGDDNA